jgi:hypothetical protein
MAEKEIKLNKQVEIPKELLKRKRVNGKEIKLNKQKELLAGMRRFNRGGKV